MGLKTDMDIPIYIYIYIYINNYNRFNLPNNNT